MSSNTPKRRSSKGKPRPQTAEGTNAETRAQSRRAQRVIQAEQAKKRQRMMIIGGGVLAAVIVALILVLVNRMGDDGISEPIVIPTSVGGVATPGSSGVVASPDASPEGSPVGNQNDGSQVLALGDPNAPVKIQEWADYQCPVCAQWATQEMPQLIEQYVNTGKVYIEFHDFPFIDRFFSTGSGGRESVRAAEAVACAMDQGQGFEMHNAIFANHHGENQGSFTQSRLVEMATGIGLDGATFESCLKDETHLDTIRASYDQAINLGVNSTPTFFINGEQVTGYQTFEQLQQRIDAELSK